MNKILSFLVVVICFSCSPKDATPLSKNATTNKFEQLPIVITGEREYDSEIKNYWYSSKFGREKMAMDTNRFRIDLSNDQPMVLNLWVGHSVKFPIFVLPGDSLHLVFDENDILNEFGGIKFSGAHARENDLFYDLQGIFKYDNTAHHYFYNVSQEAFLNQIDSLEQAGRTFIQKAQKKYPDVSPFFVEEAEAFIQAHLAHYLEDFPKIVQGGFKKNAIVKNETYLKKEAQFFEEETKLLNNIAYLNLIKRKMSNGANEIFWRDDSILKETWKPEVDVLFFAADSIFKNKAIQDYAKFEGLRYAVKNRGNYLEIYLKKYQASNPPSHYLGILNLEFEDYTEKFSSKVVFPNYKFEDINGRMCSLEELKGLVIYIDIWATWCGPCHRQRKHFEKLIDLYRDEEDLVFVGISLDEPKNKMLWKKMVEDKQIQGIQLFAGNGLESQLVKDFNIYGIPRFMIIGRNGEIIYANALNPDADNIHEILDKSLEKRAGNHLD